MGSRGGGTIDAPLRNYRLGKILGHGSFGKVKIADHLLTGREVAIKILNREKMKTLDMEEKLRREIKISKLFVHPHVIRLYEVIETPSDIYVVMECAKSGELFDYIVKKGKLQEDEARRLFQQIIAAVEYCHRNRVVHRDLKPENILLDERGNVKIADFGLSNIMRDGHFLKTCCGSPNYAAPEVVSGKLYAGPEVDVWNCGIILYALLCGKLPFEDDNMPYLFRKIKNGLYTLPGHLSPGARDLIPRILNTDPVKRITISDIRQHQWFKIHLPRYLAVPLPDAMQHLEKLDEEILHQVIRMGFDRKQLLQSLQKRIHDDATVAYSLLYDNHRSLASNGYLGAEFQESMVLSEDTLTVDILLSLCLNKEEEMLLHSAVLQLIPLKWHLLQPLSWEEAAIVPDICLIEFVGFLEYEGGKHVKSHRDDYSPGLFSYLDLQLSTGNGIPQEASLTQLYSTERKWQVGLQSSANPQEIMNQVLRTLQELNVRWKKIGHYNMKCLWFHNPGLHSKASIHMNDDHSISNATAVSAEAALKFEMQLYKTQDQKYLLDLQRISGPEILFLDFCASFIMQLYTPQ